MGITLGGIMRGALPVLQQGLEAPMQNAVARMDNMGKLYNAKAGEFQKKQADALSDVDKIKTLANGLGVELGVAEAAYKMSGKSVDKAGKIINNMVKAFKGNIPTSKLPVVEMPTGQKVDNLESTQKVEIAPQASTSEGIFKSFSNLFKMYSPDDVKKMFAERSGIPLEQVDKVLNNTFNLPSTGAKVAPTAEAIRAGMEGPPSGGSQFQQRLSSMMNVIRSQPGNENKSEAELRALAEQAVLNAPVKGAQGEYGTFVYTNDGPRFETIDRYVGGKLAAPSREIETVNKELIQTNYGNLERVGKIRKTLAKYPNAFNFIGKLRMKLTDFSDMVGAKPLSDAFAGGELQDSLQSAILFFKGAKDAIFKDPRISDQDKLLIEQYLGILNDPTVGSTRAMAAITGLERQFVTSMASSFAVNTGAGKPGGFKLIETREDGTLLIKDGDRKIENVAKMVFDKLVESQGLDLNSNDPAMQRQVAQAMILSKNSIAAYQASLDPRYKSLDDYKKRATANPYLIQASGSRT